MNEMVMVYAWLVTAGWIGLWFKYKQAIEDRDNAENAYYQVLRKINAKAGTRGRR